ncbi:MAG: 7TM diverse intracellular signaling domain-containing protein [Crocinitomicaceae bacterium]
MKWLLFIFLIFTAGSFLFGFDEQPTDKDIVILDKNLSFFVDYDFTQTIHTINKVPFKKGNFDDLNLGFFYGQLWCKFDVKGKLPEDCVFELDNPIVDKVELFILKNGAWHSLGAVGDMVPFNERKKKNRFPQIDITETGSYLVKIKSRGEALSCKMTLYGQNRLDSREYKRNVLAGFYLGLFVVVLIFNVFLFFIMRGRKNLVLIFYILSMLIYNLGFSGYGFQLFWPNSPSFQNHVMPWFGCVSVILLVQFCIWFFDVQRLNRISFRIFTVSRYLLLFIMLIGWSDTGWLHKYINITTDWLSILLFLVVIPILVQAVKRNFVYVRFVLISFLFAGLGNLVNVLVEFGFFQNTIFANVHFQLGTNFQVMFLTLSILDLYKQYQERITSNMVAINDLRENKIKKLETQVVQRTNDLIRQKKEMEFVNREVTSSITYAHRIQSSLIPGEREFLQGFKGGFVCFRPKEIVSGDFYWSTKVMDKTVTGEMVEKTVICVGDTNDHGVPGAVLSVLAFRIAQEVINTKEVTNSGMVLDAINKEFDRLYKDILPETERLRSLSCSVCVIDQQAECLDFSAANGRICIERDGMATEYESPNNAIGENLSDEPYAIIHIPFQKGDTLYLKTDGFEKQLELSYPATKKMNLIELLEVNASYDVYQRKINLVELFDKMLLKQEQVDDICIIGIQL